MANENPGLPALKEDKELTAAAQHKAEYRAARLLKDGHQGPTCPAGCREDGRSRAWWGWLTCVMEETGTHAGAGVAIRSRRRALHGADPPGSQGHAPLADKCGPELRPPDSDAPANCEAR
ncbi:MAG: hypothetical protein R3C02_07640 [Planctomycetaceae bacterium]